MVNLTKKLAIASGISLMMMTATANAGTISGNIEVKMTIDNGCLIENLLDTGGINQFGILDFGTASMLDQNYDAQTVDMGATPGLLTLVCTLGTAYSAALDNGLNPDGTQRRMANGSNYIAYDLYQNSARTETWDQANPNGGTISLTNLKADLTVYGRVPPAAEPAVQAGTYTDTVVMTITW